MAATYSQATFPSGTWIASPMSHHQHHHHHHHHQQQQQQQQQHHHPHPFERKSSFSNDQAHGYAYPRPQFELPRPLEPRPTLQASHSESSTSRRQQDAFHTPANRDDRTQSHKLPGLKDILTHAPPASSSPPRTAWNATSRRPSYQVANSDGQYGPLGLHPPMVLHHPSDHNARYQPQQGRPFEVPVLETSPVAKHPPQALSPYNPYPDPMRDYMDHHERHRQASTSSYGTNGLHSPYGPMSIEEGQYKNQATAFDRSSNPAYAPAGADSQKKYLGVKDVAGEGSFHFYEGGYRIPTHVDGEQVNPAWGLTKANKPRKRLALACLDCREKKIKCEPGASSCLQCEKAKRTCRRAPLQTSTNEVTSSSWEGELGSPLRKTTSNPDAVPAPNHDTEPDHLNKRRAPDEHSPPHLPSKKHKSTSPISAANVIDVSERSTNQPREITPPPRQIQTPPEDARKGMITLEDDPYEVDPDFTLHLLDLYFAHINNATYCVFPRSHFLHWLKSCRDKCLNERMVLYAMLALASIFAEPAWAHFGKQCAQIAEDALYSRRGKSNVPVAHTKLLLGVYHFSKGSIGTSWDYIGSAIRTTFYLRLNTEEGCLDDESSLAQSRLEFSFSKEQLTECKRRLFWSAFIVDRYGGAPSPTIKPQDVFLRLPCTDDMYEQSIASDAPFFPNEALDPASSILTPASPLGPMAWLILVVGMMGDVNDFIFHASHRPTTSYRDAYVSFYNDFSNRTQSWLSRLPERYHYSESNLARSIEGGYAGTFISMHAVYHLAHMKLNRGIRHTVMPESVSHNIRMAHRHAHLLLQVMSGIQSASRQVTTPRQITTSAPGQPPIFNFSTPFPGYATLAAIDVVSGGGPESGVHTTLAEMDSGIMCLRELSHYWSSSRDQLKACEKRYYQIKALLTNGQRARSGAWLGKNWGVELPMEQDRPQEDCIYGLGDSAEAIRTYFSAFAEDASRPSLQGGLRAS